MSGLRQWVQFYFGVSELPTKGQLAGVEKANRERHEEVLVQFRNLVPVMQQMAYRLDVLEQQFTIQHIPRRTAAFVSKDWEQVQTEELANMLANPPKEEN